MGKIFFFHKRCKVQIFLLLLFSVYSLILSHSALGATLNLTATWTANTDPDMKEYHLYRTDGTRTLLGTTLHPNTSYPFTVTVPDRSSGTLAFVLTAVDTNNNESADSNLASYIYNLNTMTLSGNVRTSGGTGISGVVMGGFPNSPTTDANGYYSDTVSYGWSGTGTPNKSGYTFSPPSLSYSNVVSNQTNQNYTATLQTFTISGYVKTSGSAGISGVVMGGLPSNPTTDANGYYSGTVSYGWSGTVTPSKSGYTFSPPSRSFSNLASNQTGQDYTGIMLEVISTPTTPSGNSSGYTGTSYKFSTGGSKSNLGTGHPVEYQFDWGDGTFSSWGSPSLSSYSQSHVWSVPGTYPVRAWARCKNHPNNVSAWSNSSISVQGKPFIQVTSPNGGENLVAGTTHTITWNSAYLNPSGTIYIFYWCDGAWHPITTLLPNATSFNWTIPRTSAKASSPKPSGLTSSTSLWIGNWVNGKWECYDRNNQSFRILYDGWVCKISNGDQGGASLLFDEGVFDGYGISLELGMFGIDGTYSVNAQGSMSGTYTVYDFSNPTIVFYAGNFTGSVDSKSTKLSLVLNALDGTPVFNMAGVRLVNDPVIPVDWTGTLSGSAKGTLNPLTIDPYQLGTDVYSYVFEFSGSGSMTGSGSINILGYFYFTATNPYYYYLTNVYGIYQITGAVNEVGTFMGTLNPTSGTVRFTLTSSNGNQYTLSGQKVTP